MSLLIWYLEPRGFGLFGDTQGLCSVIPGPEWQGSHITGHRVPRDLACRDSSLPPSIVTHPQLSCSLCFLYCALGTGFGFWNPSLVLAFGQAPLISAASGSFLKSSCWPRVDGQWILASWLPEASLASFPLPLDCGPLVLVEVFSVDCWSAEGCPLSCPGRALTSVFSSFFSTDLCCLLRKSRRLDRLPNAITHSDWS